MARVTVEDCLERVENRFQLIHLASKRTKQLIKGSKSLVDTRDNKYVVTSLREIAAGKVRAILMSPTTIITEHASDEPSNGKK